MKKLQILSLLVTPIFLFIACQPTATETPVPTKPQVKLPMVLKKGLEEHGGIEQWNKMSALTFAFNRGEEKEVQKISLGDRKSLITRDSVQVGFDGKEVWVAPNKAAYGKGSARFYHNLIFYFYAMPFVLADPGIIYEEVSARVIEDISYPGVKISYHDDVGDAPDDYYIAYFHPETSELYLLLYTVTYYQDGPSTKYSALVYDSWQEVNGLKLPLKMVGYKFENDTLGAKRYERSFEGVTVSEKAFESGIFDMPEVAEIDSLIKR